MKKLEGWIQTDGSDSTLQYGRKINNTTWEYMQWTDKPWEEVHKSAKEKLNDLDNEEWDRATIDLSDYSEGDIISTLMSFGYEHVYFEKEGLCFEQCGEYFSGEQAVQLACECLFELET